MKKVKGLAALSKAGVWILIGTMLVSLYVGKYVAPTWTVETAAIDASRDSEGKLFYTYREKPKYIQITPAEASQLTPNAIEAINESKSAPLVTQEFIAQVDEQTGETIYYKLTAKKHWKFWSLLPAFVAILLCFVIKEPMTALMGGIVSGAFILGQYNLLDDILIPRLTTSSVANVLVLYLILLGGILGVWSRTGAAKAFADLMAKKFVKGPNSARLVAWLLGVIFHQGGTMSTVLVGTTVKPLTDKEKISHEELSYIVDSTASPIASLLPFNAWPTYVQAFIYVSGVSWLLTEVDRVNFFFKSIPLSFYSIIAVTMTFLLSIDKLPWVNKQLKDAIKRARTTGELDAPDAEPLSAKELTDAHAVPRGYKPNVMEFFIPILVIMGTTMFTYIFLGSPKVNWGFGLALTVAILMALLKGMELKTLIKGLEDGLKGVVVGAIILILAMTIGGISKDLGGGNYLVELLGSHIPYWSLPVFLQALTMLISFSTGTSWGTYAVTFPLAMPLSYAVAVASGLGNPELYMLICFTTVLNGSVFGDQCSPISDTTVLSSMVTGCDLMDHVRTQFKQASVAAGIAAIGWTLLTFLAA